MGKDRLETSVERLRAQFPDLTDKEVGEEMLLSDLVTVAIAAGHIVLIRGHGPTSDGQLFYPRGAPRNGTPSWLVEARVGRMGTEIVSRQYSSHAN